MDHGILSVWKTAIIVEMTYLLTYFYCHYNHRRVIASIAILLQVSRSSAFVDPPARAVAKGRSGGTAWHWNYMEEKRFDHMLRPCHQLRLVSEDRPPRRRSNFYGVNLFFYFRTVSPSQCVPLVGCHPFSLGARHIFCRLTWR